MALGFYFTPASFTPEKYDEVISRLEAAGAGAPAGRRYHVALEADGRSRCSTSGTPKSPSRPLG